MAKFIILFFMITGGGVSYFTYLGTGQDKISTLEKEQKRSFSSLRSGSWGGGSSYGSGGYSYGK